MNRDNPYVKNNYYSKLVEILNELDNTLCTLEKELENLRARSNTSCQQIAVGDEMLAVNKLYKQLSELDFSQE